VRTITMQACRAVEPVVEDWFIHLIDAMPVLANEGIIFDKTSKSATHVNHRYAGQWTVSFRRVGRAADMRHYANATDAARAIIRKSH
jgi:hypothetical protein